jgi:hypothetical protein
MASWHNRRVNGETALAATATLIATAFCLSTLERYLARRRPHELAWTISLALFAGASGALWLGAAAGWTSATFRVFFLLGAILNVPWLALGTVYLLAGPVAGDRGRRALSWFSAFATGVVLTTPLRAPLPPDDLPRGSEVFDLLPRLFAGVCSGGAALVLVAGAVWSAGRVAKGRARGHAGAASARQARGLAVGNALIAAGTLVLSASGTLNARLGAMTAFAVTLAVGITVLFAGFLVASVAGSRPRSSRLDAQAAA